MKIDETMKVIKNLLYNLIAKNMIMEMDAFIVYLLKMETVGL